MCVFCVVSRQSSPAIAEPSKHRRHFSPTSHSHPVSATPRSSLPTSINALSRSESNETVSSPKMSVSKNVHDMTVVDVRRLFQPYLEHYFLDLLKTNELTPDAVHSINAEGEATEH